MKTTKQEVQRALKLARLLFLAVFLLSIFGYALFIILSGGLFASLQGSPAEPILQASSVVSFMIVALLYLEQIKDYMETEKEGVEVHVFENYTDVLEYVADAMNKYTHVYDTSWLPLMYIGDPGSAKHKRVFRKYQRAKEAAARRYENGEYREIWTFPRVTADSSSPDYEVQHQVLQERFREARELLKTAHTACYTARYFPVEDQQTTRIPQNLTFMLLGEKDDDRNTRIRELIILSYKQKPDDNRILVRNNKLVGLFYSYYMECWDNSAPFDLSALERLRAERTGNCC